MEVGRRLRKRDLKSIWSKRSALHHPPSPTSSGRTTPSSTPTRSDSEGYTYDDQKRSTWRYIEAVRILEEAVQEHGVPGTAFDELSGEPTSYSDSLFRE